MIEFRSTFIRKTFFPRWDRERQWRIVADSQMIAMGKCFRDSRLIKIPYITSREDDLYELLIHEICHAVTDDYHSRRWKARMLKAAEKAENIGFPSLGEVLRRNILGYNETVGSISAACIYSRVEEYLRESPNLAYLDVVEGIACELGSSPEELKSRCTRLRRVYVRASKGRQRDKVVSPWLFAAWK